MNTDSPAISSSWDVNRVRSGLLNSPPSRMDTRPLLPAFLKLKGRTLLIRRFAVGKQAKLLELIDQAAPTDFAQDPKLVTMLGEISSDTGLLPNSVGSLQGLDKCGSIAVASGGTTDIWRGVWNDKPVSLKAFRIYPLQDLKEAKKILWKFVPIWKRLVHDNVLPFHGVETSMFDLALVYDWAYNGNIMQYLKSHPDASRPELLLQVAKGLQYLHSFETLHGDLKGANVVISRTGIAQVCDYGLTPIISNPTFTIAATPGTAGSPRWLAPEIIEPPKKTDSKQITASKFGDVFAFAMLVVEVFTGKVPFANMTNGSVIIQMANRRRPPQPQAAEHLGLTPEMWRFVERCWSQNPDRRPTIDEVVRTWEGFVNGDNNRASASIPEPSGRQSQFADSSNTCTRQHDLPPRKTGLFCI